MQFTENACEFTILWIPVQNVNLFQNQWIFYEFYILYKKTHELLTFMSRSEPLGIHFIVQWTLEWKLKVSILVYPEHSFGVSRLTSKLFRMMQTDRLVEINREDLRLLRSFYTPNSFKNVIACMTIDNYIRWFEEDPEIEGYKFFCLNGDFSDGTFILLVSICHL